MTLSKSIPVSAAQLDNAVWKLEEILRNKPDNIKAIRALVEILDWHQPSKQRLGAYTDFQRTLSTKIQESTGEYHVFHPRDAVEYYKQWQAAFDSICEIPQLIMEQLFAGRNLTIHDETTYCNLNLSLFKKEGVIPKICRDCFKIQVLPLDLAALMQIYVIFDRLKLPRDNHRKCMIELREDIPYPYKGYIYCESEDEAYICLEELQQILKTLQISNVYCGISHGCSEYGLKYPEFKYSNDGAHHSFERPALWDQAESGFWFVNQKPTLHRKDYSKKGISIRDMMVFRTWIDYAEIIGDESSKRFRDTPSTNKPRRFAEKVRTQSHLRMTQMEELRQRLSSTV